MSHHCRGSSHFVYVHRQGEESSQDERGTSAILAVQLDAELGGSAVQVTLALCNE